MGKGNEQKLWRIIDANFNRAKEAMRVCEDVCRFIYDQPRWTRRYKDLRHQLTAALEAFSIDKVICAREVERDVGRGSNITESQRRTVEDIFYANSQRCKESVRVLEEFAKLRDKNTAEKIKKLRYRIYALEKEIVKKII